MKRIAIMQPYFFPYIGYFQLINAVDKFILYDDVNYINKGWVNRNNVLVGGKSTLITLPLIGASQNKKIYEIDTANDMRVHEKLMRTIALNYKKAPYFDQVYEMVQNILSGIGQNIADFNLNQVKSICGYLDIQTEIVDTSRVYDNIELKGEQRILDICIKEAANIYINPIGGVDLYDRSRFQNNKIKLLFIKSRNIVYDQFSQPFVPWLSIIDVLMFNSNEKTKMLLNQYELV